MSIVAAPGSVSPLPRQFDDIKNCWDGSYVLEVVIAKAEADLTAEVSKLSAKIATEDLDGVNPKNILEATKQWESGYKALKDQLSMLHEAQSALEAQKKTFIAIRKMEVIAVIEQEILRWLGEKHEEQHKAQEIYEKIERLQHQLEQLRDQEGAKKAKA